MAVIYNDSHLRLATPAVGEILYPMPIIEYGAT